MRITDITVYSYIAEYNGGTYSMSNGRTCTGQPSIVVRIRTDSDIEGWAENAPLGSDYLPSSFTGELAALKELGPQILGLDPRCPGAISAKLDRAMMSGMSAKSVIDIACWDILGKATGLPTHILLGGRLFDAPPAFSVIGFGEIPVAVQKALAEHAKGVVAMQVKVGDDPLVDARRARAIREALPESVNIFADANASWNLSQALIFARALGQDVTIPFEQPCRSLSDCAQVARLTGLPIILDECIVTMADLVTAHAAGITGVNIKLSRVGGITKARILRDTAVALEMNVNIDDTWGCALTTTQNLQLAASTRPDRLGAVDCFAEWTHPLIAEVPRMQVNGRLTPSSVPGNGYRLINVEMLGEPLFYISK
ncbi:enolase C-terminal domain-like protein [Aaosphaeria arxii CBS 175.79]|uniref:Enolase C-terminal domain-like protein n=1 Tax=Aaosphaeria arxii CBS 175.79 TaxID=1450172 RepID=A0A6A5XP02_9PLEO|nr:enolase C-terminal domain-like protein [Aaosphaeria arxii CBS 175.79]KAF2014084.1 enolase C-terminal domain-like protein [Aaosphaeria arxii CBS 175.79]